MSTDDFVARSFRRLDEHFQVEWVPASIIRRKAHHRQISRRLGGACSAVAVALILALVLTLTWPASRNGSSTAAAAELTVLSQLSLERSPISPPQAGQYFYTESQKTIVDTVFVTKSQSISVLVPETRQFWEASDGSGRLVVTTAPPIFLSSKDQALWQAAGSPSIAQPSGSQQFGPGGLSAIDLSKLPTDEVALASMISERKIESGPPGAAESFVQIGDLLRETDASPALRSALFTVASNLPGVEYLGQVSDHSGRLGVGFAVTNAGVKHELIFSSSTSALLGETQINVNDPSYSVPNGAVVGWTVYQSSGLVGSTSEVPS